MTFEQYKQGLKDIINNGNNTIDRKHYNKKAQEECDFSINLGVLGSALKRNSRFGSAEIEFSTILSPMFNNQGKINKLTGVAIINMVYNIQNDKRVVEEWARFSINENTKLTNGSTLRDNVYVQNNYGRVRLHLMPDTEVKDLIVKLDLTDEYMNYPAFVKALLSCNVIENDETFTK